MRQVDSLTVSVVVDNTTDMLSARPPHVTSELRVLFAAGMRELAGEGLCSAHHGLSLLITARTNGQERTVLFDAGLGVIGGGSAEAGLVYGAGATGSVGEGFFGGIA
jgi:hypothetical protein